MVNENGGYIKLYRKMLDNSVCMRDSTHFAVWCWLLMNACWKPTKVSFGGKQITLKPGQLTTGRNKIAKALSEQATKIYRALKRFESEQLIEQRTDRQCTLITILNWDKYQESEQPREQEVNNEWTTSEQRNDTKEEYKEYKNIYSSGSIRARARASLPEDVADAFMEWVEMRVAINRPIVTSKGVTRAINKLQSLSSDPVEQIQIIHNAINNNWLSFWPPSEPRPGRPGGRTKGKGKPGELEDTYAMIEEWANGSQ